MSFLAITLVSVFGSVGYIFIGCIGSAVVVAQKDNSGFRTWHDVFWDDPLPFFTIFFWPGWVVAGVFWIPAIFTYKLMQKIIFKLNPEFTK